jgi:glucose-1-phosphate thymidylyltransferase
MLEHVLANTERMTGIDEIFIVTNQKFARDFENWAQAYRTKQPNAPMITVVNDGSTDDTNKLGAIGDIKFVVDRQGVRDDLLIIGGDNLFRQPLDGFVTFARQHGATVGVYDVGNLELIKKYNDIRVNSDGRITHFEEKPKHPTSTVTAICLYYYPARILPLIDQYVREGNNTDQPGRLVAWLHKHTPTYAYPIRGKWLDIGDFESLELANRHFAADEPIRKI